MKIRKTVGSREEQVDFLGVRLLEEANRDYTIVAIANVEGLDMVPDLVAFVGDTGFGAVVLTICPTDSGRALEIVKGTRIDYDPCQS